MPAPDAEFIGTENRRAHERQDCFFYADCFTPGRAPTLAVVTDLSTAGLAVALRHRPEPGEVLRLGPRRSPTRAYLIAKVVRVRRGHGVYWAGCTLEAPLAPAEMEALLAPTDDAPIKGFQQPAAEFDAAPQVGATNQSAQVDGGSAVTVSGS